MSKGREAPARWSGLGQQLRQGWSNSEEIAHVQGQRRSSSTTAEGVKSHLESNPIPAREAQRAHI